MAIQRRLPARQTTSRLSAAVPDVQVSLIPVMIVIYAGLLPREITVNLGGLMLYSDRIAMIVALPWVLYKLVQGAIRFVVPDFLVLIASLWTMLAFGYVYGAGTALSSGGALALDSAVGYYLARISFRSLTDIRRALIVLAPGLAVTGVILMIESITRVGIVQPAAEALFGRLAVFVKGVDQSRLSTDFEGNIRLGLLRAKGQFSHPIHAGIYLASMAALYGMSGLRGWPMWAGRIGSLLSVFTLSSAAFGALLINYGGMFFDWLQRRVRELSWHIGFAGFALAMFFAQTTTNIGAIGFVQRYLVLDSSTAFFRQLIWEFGSISVRKHPWFGIGFEDYERPSWMLTNSVDAHWLAVAIRSGLVPSLALLIASIMAIVALAKSSRHVPYVDQRFYRGIAISLTGFV